MNPHIPPQYFEPLSPSPNPHSHHREPPEPLSIPIEPLSPSPNCHRSPLTRRRSPLAVVEALWPLSIPCSHWRTRFAVFEPVLPSSNLSGRCRSPFFVFEPVSPSSLSRCRGTRLARGSSSLPRRCCCCCCCCCCSCCCRHRRRCCCWHGRRRRRRRCCCYCCFHGRRRRRATSAWGKELVGWGDKRRRGENEPQASLWFVFATHWLGLPPPGYPLVFLPPKLLHRAKTSRPHPSGKERGGYGWDPCSFLIARPLLLVVRPPFLVVCPPTLWVPHRVVLSLIPPRRL